VFIFDVHLLPNARVVIPDRKETVYGRVKGSPLKRIIMGHLACVERRNH